MKTILVFGKTVLFSRFNRVRAIASDLTCLSGPNFLSQEDIAVNLYDGLRRTIRKIGLSTQLWRYADDMLPYGSAHSKLVKREINSSCLASSSKKSCPHKVSSGFRSQVVIWHEVGFPLRVVCDAAEGLIKNAENAW